MIEKQILSHLLLDLRCFAELFHKRIDSLYFEDLMLREFFYGIMKHFRAYNSLLSFDEFEILIKNSHKNEQDSLNFLALYQELYHLNDQNNFSFLLDQFIEHYRKRLIRTAIVEGAELINKGKVDEAESTLFKATALANTLTQEKFEEVLGTSTRERLQRYEDSKVIDNRKAILTGFETLDRITGGIQPGELWVIEGWAKAGKSITLLNIGFNAWYSYGKSVLYISCELSEKLVARRLDARGAGVSYNDLKFSSLNEEDYAKYTAFLKESSEKSNDFSIMYEPGCSTTTIHQKIRDLKLTKGLDLVIVDYIGICTSAAKSQARHEEVGNIALELRNIAGKERIPILTAHQKNRAGQLAGKLGTEYAGESIKIPQHCDLYFAIRAKNEDEKRLSNKYDVECQILAARDSAEGQWELECFKDRMLMVEKRML